MPRNLYEGLPGSWDGITDDGRDYTSVPSAEQVNPSFLQVLSEQEEEEALQNIAEGRKNKGKVLPEAEVMKLVRALWRSRTR